MSHEINLCDADADHNNTNISQCNILKINKLKSQITMSSQDDIACKKCGEIYIEINHKWCKPCQINGLNQNFANWTSGNETIDKLIQEMQLKIKNYDDIIVEWISFDQFNDIKKIYEDDFNILYSAIWIDGPFKCNESDKIRRKRIPNKKVVLEYLNNSQNNNITKEFLNEVKSYSIENDDYSNIITIYGISQNPDTKDYVIVLEDCYCVNCGKIYTDKRYKWCNPCLLNELKQNFENWTSGNEKVDEFIQQMKLQVKSLDDSIFEWIPYNQLNTIKEIDMTLYSAIWINGPLRYNYDKMEWEKIPNEKINLIYFDSSLKLTKQDDVPYDKMCGISQDPDTNNYILIFQDCYCKNCGKIYTNEKYKWCKPCQINYLKQSFANWTSGNEKIDELIQEMQLKINKYSNLIVEWIPYNQFNDIKKVGDDDSANILYSATWMDGLLEYDCNKIEYKRIPNKEVGLKYFGNNIINEFLNEIKSYFAEHSKRVDIYGISQDPVAKDYVMVKSYSIENDDYSNIITIYGISQNPDTKDYVIVLEDCYCVNCGKIYTDKRYKWCNPCLLNELKQNFENWTSGNEKVDEFIQQMKLQVKSLDDSIFEWIPYNQLNTIKEIDMTLYSAIWINGPLRYNYDKMEWEKIPNEKINLIYFDSSLKLTKQDDVPYDKMCGISQDPDTNNYILIFQDCYCKNCGKIYTNEKYKWCKPCQINYLKQSFANWTSGNEKIDELIQEMQLKINKYSNLIVEWIPYNQFNDIKKVGDDDSANILYSATWMDGLLEYDCNKIEYKRIPNKEVGLKYFGNNIINEFLNEIKSYFAEHSKRVDIYGISQDPVAKDYVMVLQNGYCEICKYIYGNIKHKWCKQCFTNSLKQNFTNWTSGNEKIDEFIQQMQLRVNNLNDSIVEWIPYNQFNDFKILYESDFVILYSAIFVNGPFCYNYDKMEWKREPNEKVTLIRLNNLEITIDQILNKIKEYIDERRWRDTTIKLNKTHKELFYAEGYITVSQNNNIVKVYGISQNPDSKDYIIVLQDWCCENCNEMYESKEYKWCNSCQIDNLKQSFANWTSENEQIDEIVQNLQLDIKKHNDIIVEWIPYNHFNNIKELVKGDYATLYLANWMNGLLRFEYYKWKRRPNAKVTLKCLHNSQDITDEILNEKIESYYIRNIEGKNEEEGHYCYRLPKIYGISRNPNTKDYIMVLENGNHCETCGEIYTEIDSKWCESCQVNNLIKNFTNWTSGNEIIDKFIQGIQLVLQSHRRDITVEWIPYNQFNDIEKIGNDSAILYSATWIDGPLEYDEIEWERISNKKVTLKYLYDSYNITNKSLNEEVESYINGYFDIPIIYGMSQNPDTNDYILVLRDEIVCEKCIQIYTDISSKECNPCKINDLKQNFANWTSGNKQIDELIQKMQLESKDYDTVVEWVPYNQLSNIKRIGKIDSNILYSATWIKWDYEVALKYLSNLKNNNTDEFLNEIKSYFIEYKSKIYGLSQDPSTKDYIVVLQSGSHCKICGRLYINSWCKSCQMSVLKNNFENWTSKNKIIDELIQEMQLKIQNYNDIIVEWIPYDQLNDIKEIGKDVFATLYSATWIDGPLKYNTVNNKCIRNHNNKEVALKNLCNSQNINEFLNEVKSYFFTVDVPSHDINFTPKIYGISQNLDTKDYIIVLDDCYCENCGKIYTDIGNKWCKPCQIEDIKRGFANWTSENKKIDKLIQEMQLKINKYNDIIVEWIPYDQFNDIKKRGKGGFSTVYSASWTDGPLRYRKDYKKLKRKCNEEVALKCLHNSQNITNGFLHEVKNYSISDDDGILKIYGISQNPRTKDYIIVLQLASGNFAECKYIKKPWYWTEKLHILNGIIDCLKDIHDNKMVHRDLHIGNILTLPHVTINSFRGNIIQKVCISDMGLCREICNLDNMDETKVYGVLPYVAPEVLRGKSYTQAADIYSFGMIMYFVATRRQPFANCAHDEALALNICNGIRPEINELEVPKSYIELMKKCWNSNPDDRPKTIEIKEEINKQIEEAEKNKMNFSFTGNNKPTHSQAFYTSRLLNPFTKNFRKYDNISNNSIEVIDFTKVI
ncbi:hypothetical protein RclHR1_01150020 [Rhizophagus clarus]|uniref:Protein kinase domain-containing protein n=1 Tax=Rhizophagus clarus TaxID=94130 RepID=A0A2Z6QXC8_9GLOM|nr:hypothetical protein RclHR1_01150020 [Rhizophagus clarus]